MQSVNKLKNWFWDATKATKKITATHSNNSKGAWQGSSSSVSNLGVKTQSGGSWLKKGFPLVVIITGGVWAVSYFTGSNPTTGIWSNEVSSMQTLEANLGATMEATSNATSSTVERTKSAVSLPNGERVEFTKGSFDDNLTTWLASNEKDWNKTFTFDNLNFEIGSAELKEESMVQLQNLAKVLNAYSSVQIRIEGHTDNTGNAAANKLLSQQRAETAKEWLVTYANIDATRIATQGWGSEKPVSSNDTDENRLKNIRTEMVIIQK